MNNMKSQSFVDGSRLIVEAAVEAGGDVFIGYPITPANLLYLYSSQRFPLVLPAPDEITTLQWMAGCAAAGKVPVTATSFPGLALMIESIGMSFMMELPMVIILVQRLGPATGTATCGSQGDINVINGLNSGGYPVPTLCISDMYDCWNLSAEAVKLAIRLNSPVILLTSKEMVMTQQSFDLNSLPDMANAQGIGFQPVSQEVPNDQKDNRPPYMPYQHDDNGLRTHIPVGNSWQRTRLTASTHDAAGNLQHTTTEAMDNTRNLLFKTVKNLDSYLYYTLDEQECDTIVLAFDITAAAAREAVQEIRNSGKKVSLLIAKTLFPVPPDYISILNKYKRVLIAEENIDGQYRKVLFGESGRIGVQGVNAIGRMISPSEIVSAYMEEAEHDR